MCLTVLGRYISKGTRSGKVRCAVRLLEDGAWQPLEEKWADPLSDISEGL